jgi:hypothetical protein
MICHFAVSLIDFVLVGGVEELPRALQVVLKLWQGHTHRQ